MIENRGQFFEDVASDTALSCIEAGIQAARPERVVAQSVSRQGPQLTIGPDSVDLDAYEQVVLVGGGKAAAQVAAALEEILGETLNGGVVVTDTPCETQSVDVLPADHPIPSERGVAATRTLLDRAARYGPETLVIAVITGGGSACMVAPTPGISLEDLQATTESLLDSGAPIDEVNAVRKHLSAIKGGGLAEALAPARVTALVLSDVVGDNLSVIASGPVVPDESTYDDALGVLATRDISVPDTVRNRLEHGASGEHNETPGPAAQIFDRVSTHVIGSNMTALRGAKECAQRRGYQPLILSSRVRGDAREAALAHVAIAEEIIASGNPVSPPAVVLSGGETTVAVTGDGDGGPNQEFALAAARELPPGAVLAAADTDGIDGSTDAAGALVDDVTVSDKQAANRALATNDTNHYLEGRDALIRTGPTGTNVNDIRILVVEDIDEQL